jgi:hypothetical protein
LQLPVRDVDDEPIQILSVQCPSTGRRYLLRAPPWVTTCFQAAAWMADLDPSVYVPIKET